MADDHNGSSISANSGLPLDEDALVERIRAKFGPPKKGDLGIGDDAAILRDSSPLVITTDLLMEGVDFFSDTPLWFVGRKALTANLSDLAAMGSEPVTFLLTLGFPQHVQQRLDELLDGLAAKAGQYRISLSGGDLSIAESILISITAIGRMRNERPLLRSAARVGDHLFVSRPLGAPAAGLELLRAGWNLDRSLAARAPSEAAYEIRELGASLLRAQLDPDPEIALGSALGKLATIGACIDLSDGLSRDLPRICEASRVGATIDWDRLPIFPDLDTRGTRLGLDPAHCALHGGEEYSLLFTARTGEAELSTTLGRPVYRIGRIDKEPGVRLNRGGRIAPLPPLGFDHFRSS